MMNSLFEPTTIKSLNLPNRFVRSATWEAMAADDGSVTDSLINVTVKLAEGGVGLIISGHAFVRKEGQAGSRQLAIYSDDMIDGLAKMTSAVHESGGKIAAQLAHAGSATRMSGIDRIAPSAIGEDTNLPSAREMTLTDFKGVVGAFAAAAGRAKTAGFDAVQIHGAHGYLVSQFLSATSNKRTDEFGGSITNRARFAVMVVEAIREVVGSGFPVFIKINSEDFLPTGMSVDDMLQTIELLEAAGLDAIELSGGSFMAGKNNPIRQGKAAPGEREAYYVEAARRAKQTVKIPIMLVGGIRSLETAERLVHEGVTDYIALCRPLICEPDLINRWKSGDRRPSECPSDNGCIAAMIKGKSLFCAMKDRKKD